MTTLVWKSTIASLLIQVLVGGVTVWGLTLQNDSGLLRTSLGLEVASQAIEFAWYSWVVCYYGTIQTWTRYIDWVFSTPVMILSTALFLVHRDGDASELETPIYSALALNAAMLAFGFALETGVIPLATGLLLGGACFVGSFTVLALYVDEGDPVSVALFTVMFCVWGLYGVAAAFPYEPKNVAYNVLDLVSKNFYGVFLTLYLYTG